MTDNAVFTHVTGRVIDTRAYHASLGGGIPAEYHHEFWIMDPAGKEFHVHLVDDKIPIRNGHQLEVIFQEQAPVAVLNHSTRHYINLVPHSYYDLDSVLPKFPSMISFRDIGIVIFTFLMIGVAFETKPLIGWLLLVLGCTAALWRNRHRPQLVRNELYYKVQAEIMAVYGQ